MKLTPRDAESFLKNPMARSQAVLLYGPDSGLARERARQLAQVILGKNPDPLQRVEMSNDQIKNDPACLHDELSALSLMGGQRLILLQGAGDKIASIIEEAYVGLTPAAYLIVEAGELGASSPLRYLFEKEPRFAALACYRDDGRALEEVIRATLQAHGLRAHSDAMQYLAANLGNDRGVTLSELEKIALYMGTEKDVTLETAMLLTDHNAAETTDDICHEAAAGNAAGAEALLTQLLREGAQPIAIMRALLRHFHRLEMALSYVHAGSSPAEALTHLRPPVFYKYVPTVTRALSRWQSRRLAAVQNLLLKAEKDMKSSAVPPALLARAALQQVTALAG